MKKILLIVSLIAGAAHAEYLMYADMTKARVRMGFKCIRVNKADFNELYADQKDQAAKKGRECIHKVIKHNAGESFLINVCIAKPRVDSASVILLTASKQLCDALADGVINTTHKNLR